MAILLRRIFGIEPWATADTISRRFKNLAGDAWISRGILAGCLLLAGVLLASAQGNYVISFTGQNIAGTINFTTKGMTAYPGNSASFGQWNCPGATINMLSSGLANSYSGFFLYAFTGNRDGNGQFVDEFVLVWDASINFSDSLGIEYPLGTLGNAGSLPAVIGLMGQGFTGSVSNSPGGNFLNYGYNSSGQGGTQGALTSFSMRSIASPVALAINRSKKNITLSWPVMADGFQLQSSSLLGTNASWTSITNPPAIINANYSVTLPATNKSRFFRLQSKN